METDDLYQNGILFLKEKKFKQAVEAFEVVFDQERDSQSFETLFTALVGLISELRDSGQDHKSEVNTLKELISLTSTPKEVFGFSYSTVTKSKLTKRFKFLALIFHPDKGSENSETFVRIKSAYDTLCAGKLGQGEPYIKKYFTERRRGGEYDEESCCTINPFLLCSIFPMLMLLAISIYSSIGSLGYGYSFEKTLRYTRCTESANYNVKFCFNPEDMEYFAEIEKQAEQDWVDILLQTCRSQMMRKLYQDSLQEGSRLVNLTSCEILKSFQIPLPSLTP